MSFTQKLGFNKPPSYFKRGQLTTTSAGVPSFPSDLGSHSMMLNFYDYVGFDATTSDAASRSRGVPKEFLALPVPTNLIESYGVNYNQTGLGTLAGAATRNAGKIANSIEGLKNNIIQGAKQVYAGEFGAAGDIALEAISPDSFLEAAKVNGKDIAQLALRNMASIVPSAQGAIDILTGETINPHIANLLDSVPLRNHSFNWKLSPRNAAEDKTLQKIFMTIKRNMHPAFGGIGDSFLTYPREVEIDILGTENDLYYFKRSVITGFTVNHAPDGPAFHVGNGRPVSYDVTLNVQEVEIITQEDFEPQQIDFAQDF